MDDRRYPIEAFQADRFREYFGKETEKLSATLLTGGACNSNYLVENSKGEKFVCRIHKRGKPQAERRITEDLRGVVPVPAYLWVSEGLSIMAYIEGEHFAPTEELVRDAGRIIGRLSQVTFPRSGEFSLTGEVRSFKGWESYEKGMLALLHSEVTARYLPEKAIGDLAGILDRQTSTLQSFDACRSMVHGDFKPDNLLVSEDRIVGVIDWEFSHSGCSYMDIGNLLRHLPAKWDDHLARGLKEEGFELPDDWRFRASLIDLVSHLEFLTSERSDAFKRACADRVIRFIQDASESGGRESLGSPS